MKKLLLLTSLLAPVVLAAALVQFSDNDPVGPAAGRESRNQARVRALATTELETFHGRQKFSDRFPDIQLTDQYGNSHRFVSDLVRDHTVCLVVFYTRCTGSCPGTTRMMKQLRESLGDQFRDGDVRFLSITLDPDIDDPQILMDYAMERDLGPKEGLADWYFLTGQFDDLEELRYALGLYDLDPIIDADREEHAALITFGNDRYNRWVAMPSGIGFPDLQETFHRICGTSERQRFRLAMMDGRTVDDTADSAGSCCSNQKTAQSACGCSEKQPSCCETQATPACCSETEKSAAEKPAACEHCRDK